MYNHRGQEDSIDVIRRPVLTPYTNDTRKVKIFYFLSIVIVTFNIMSLVSIYLSGA